MNRKLTNSLERADYSTLVSHFELDLVVGASSDGTASHLALFLTRAGAVAEFEQFFVAQITDSGSAPGPSKLQRKVLSISTLHRLGT